MRHAVGLLVLSAAVGFTTTSARADVVVSTSLNLTQLQILPSLGTLSILSGFSASAYGFAEDSLGGFSQQSDPPVPGGPPTVIASASALTALASANGSASTVSLSASASSGVSILGPSSFDSSASSTGQGGFQGSFEILSAVPTPAPVSVTFNAALTGYQSLTTDAAGVGLNSEIIFNLILPGVGPTGTTVLFLDNPLSVGPNSSLVAPYSNTLTNSLNLMTNTDYALIAGADAESAGLNYAPEPSIPFLYEFSFFALLLFAGRRWRNRMESRSAA